MGLENLKSAFGSIGLNKNNQNEPFPQDQSGQFAPPPPNTDVNTSNLDLDIVEPFVPESILDATTYAYDS